MNLPIKIDLKSKSFVSNNTKYFIVDDLMGYERMKKFISLIPELSYGIAFEQIQKQVAKSISLLRRGNDMAANYIDVVEHLINFANTLKGANSEEFFEKNMEMHLDFCCLFIATENENLNSWSPSVNDRKKNDWKKDMDMYSFFLLAKMQLPGFKDLLNALQQVEGTEENQSNQNRKATIQ